MITYYKNYDHELYGVLKGEFIEEIALYLNKKNKQYFIALFKKVTESEKNLLFSQELENILAQLINISEIEKLQNMVSKIESEGEKEFFFDHRLYENIMRSNREDKAYIKLEFEKYIQNKIDKINEIRTKNQEAFDKKQRNKKQKERSQILKAFKNLKPNIYWLIQEYSLNKTIFNKKEVEIIKDLVLKVFKDEEFDPVNFTYSKEEGGRYTTHRIVAYGTFTKCLELSKEFEIDLKQFKDRLIYYTPFAFSTDLEYITKHIERLEDTHIKYLIGVYNGERGDGLDNHMPDNFLEIIKKYAEDFSKTQRKAISSILESFIRNKSLSIGHRENAIKRLSEINDMLPTYLGLWSEFKNDLNYFRDYLNGKEKNTEEELLSFKISEIINSILIVKFKRNDAISWRIEQIKNGYLEYEDRNKDMISGVIYTWSPSSIEDELTMKRSFIKPLELLKHTRYNSKILELLELSFNLSEKNKKFETYSRYIQELVTNYFINRDVNSITLLTEINDIIDKQRTKDVTYDFKIRCYARLQEHILGTSNLDEKEKEIVKLNYLLTERDEKIKRIENELTKVNQLYSNIFLYVEGKYDKRILEASKIALNDYIEQNKIPNFNIVVCGGVKGVIDQIKTHIYENETKCIYIGLLDFDFTGLKFFEEKELIDIEKGNNKWHNDLFEENYEKCRCKIHENYTNMFLSLLPVNFNIRDQVLYNNEDNIPVTYEKISHMTIELMFYGSLLSNGIILDENYNDNGCVYIKKKLPNNSHYIDLKCDKGRFVEIIEKESKFSRSTDLFENIKPVFNLIKRIKDFNN